MKFLSFLNFHVDELSPLKIIQYFLLDWVPVFVMYILLDWVPVLVMYFLLDWVPVYLMDLQCSVGAGFVLVMCLYFLLPVFQGMVTDPDREQKPL
jgi:hypothetical protein